MQRSLISTGIVLLVSTLCGTNAIAQDYDTVRIATYNVLRFGENESDRLEAFRKILSEVRPHLLAIQEIESQSALDRFVDQVASQLPIPLVPATTIRGDGDNYSTILCDPKSFRPHGGVVVIMDEPRDHLAMQFEHLESQESIVLITGHWKAGASSEDIAIRDTTGEGIRGFSVFMNLYGWNTPNVIVAADLNIYRASEIGYRKLVDAVGLGRPFHDPLDRSGSWSGIEEFADIHTQSTRDRRFGGGNEGGLDDRFDQILILDSLLDNYVEGSYTAYGNDGNHFNDSINAKPNLAVGDEMAQHLFEASDHLPVYLDLQFRNVIVGIEERREPKELPFDLRSRNY